jgi:Replication-relaxation
MVTASKKSELEFQTRDLAILRGLFDSRIATIHHLSTLYFGGRLEAARKRVQKLKAAGIINERPRKATEPSIYCLPRRAFEILEKHGVLREYPSVGWTHLEKRARVSELTLKHELEVMDCRASLSAAAEQGGYRIAEFSTWPKLFEFMARDSAGKELLVKPDGFIRIQGTDAGGGFEDMFFLELDRSSEEQQRLIDRAVCYRDFYFRGGLASRFGRPRTEFKQFPFVVLMVFKNAERRNNTAERLLQSAAPIRNQVWLTTLKELTNDSLGSIWVKPGDYSRLTTGTAFDPAVRRNQWGYRRQPEREDFIEKNIQKHRLLASASGDEQ